MQIDTKNRIFDMFTAVAIFTTPMINYFVVCSYILIYLLLSRDNETMQIFLSGLAFPIFAATVRFNVGTQWVSFMERVIEYLWPEPLPQRRQAKKDLVRDGSRLRTKVNPMHTNAIEEKEEGMEGKEEEKEDEEDEGAEENDAQVSLFADLVASVPDRTWSVSDVAELFFVVTIAVEIFSILPVTVMQLLADGFWGFVSGER